jgi:hypothetical protein
MCSILPGAIQQDLAGEKSQNVLLRVRPFRIPQKLKLVLTTASVDAL